MSVYISTQSSTAAELVATLGMQVDELDKSDNADRKADGRIDIEALSRSEKFSPRIKIVASDPSEQCSDPLTQLRSKVAVFVDDGNGRVDTQEGNDLFLFADNLQYSIDDSRDIAQGGNHTFQITRLFGAATPELAFEGSYFLGKIRESEKAGLDAVAAIFTEHPICELEYEVLCSRYAQTSETAGCIYAMAQRYDTNANHFRQCIRGVGVREGTSRYADCLATHPVLPHFNLGDTESHSSEH